MAFWITPFHSFMKSQIMSQTDSKCESYVRFHQVADPIGKRRNTWLALHFGRPRTSYWSWTCVFSEWSFRLLYEKSNNIPKGHQMRKLWSFSQGGWYNRQKKELMTCVEHWKASRRLLKLDLWLFRCVLSIALWKVKECPKRTPNARDIATLTRWLIQ